MKTQIGILLVLVLGNSILLGLSITNLNEVRELRRNINEIHDDHLMGKIMPSRTPYPNNDPNDPICGDPSQLAPLPKPAR